MFNTFSGRSKGTCWLNYEEIKDFLPEVDLQIQDELSEKRENVDDE
jgi:hypothetical protein